MKILNTCKTIYLLIALSFNMIAAGNLSEITKIIDINGAFITSAYESPGSGTQSGSANVTLYYNIAYSGFSIKFYNGSTYKGGATSTGGSQSFSFGTLGVGTHSLIMKVYSPQMELLDSYSISYLVKSNTYEVTASAGSGGTISPSSRTVASGGTTTFTASPNTGYYLSSVSGTGASKSGNTITVSNVTSTRTVTAYFTKYSYTVNASASSGGTISPSSRSVSYGNSTTFTASPNSGYHISGVSGTGASYSGNTVTVSNVTSNRTVSVSFAPDIVYYTVSASAGSGGTVSPSSRSVASGGTTTFTASPNTGYYLSSVSGTGASKSGNTITVSNVTSNRTVTAYFTKYIYTVSASAGSGGTISPSSRSVSYGNSTTFTASPNSGYHISGVSGTGASYSGNTVTVSNVTSNRSVYVYFNQFIPSISSFECLSGSSTTSRSVSFNLSASNSPTEMMLSESSSFSGASWQSYNATPSYTLSTGYGSKTVYAKVKNSGGESSSTSVSITYNPVMPTVSFTITPASGTINAPASGIIEYTTGAASGNVKVYIDNIVHADIGFQVPGTNGVSFSNLAEGTYSIKVECDNQGQVAYQTQSYVIKKALPSITTFTSRVGTTTTSRSVSFNLSASNSPTEMMLSESSSFSGASWQSYNATPSFTLSTEYGSKIVYVKVKNSGGESDISSVNISYYPTSIITSVYESPGSGTQNGTTEVTLNFTTSYSGLPLKFYKNSTLVGTATSTGERQTYNFGTLTTGTYFLDMEVYSPQMELLDSYSGSYIVKEFLVPTAFSSVGIEENDIFSLKLSWVDVDNETGYKILRRAEGETDFFEVGTIGNDINYYVDEEILIGKLYHYKVQAVNDNATVESSIVSKEIGIINYLAPETGIAEAPANVKLYYREEFNTAGLILKFYLNDIEQASITGSSDMQNYFEYEGLSFGQNKIKVELYEIIFSGGTNLIGEKTIEYDVLASIPPTNFTEINVAENTLSSLIITWDDVDFEAGYRIIRKADEELEFTEIESNLAQDTELFIDNDVTVGVNYIYKVVAFNNKGETESPEIVNKICIINYLAPGSGIAEAPANIILYFREEFNVSPLVLKFYVDGLEHGSVSGSSSNQNIYEYNGLSAGKHVLTVSINDVNILNGSLVELYKETIDYLVLGDIKITDIKMHYGTETDPKEGVILTYDLATNGNVKFFMDDVELSGTEETGLLSGQNITKKLDKIDYNITEGEHEFKVMLNDDPSNIDYKKFTVRYNSAVLQEVQSWVVIPSNYQLSSSFIVALKLSDEFEPYGNIIIAAFSTDAEGNKICCGKYTGKKALDLNSGDGVDKYIYYLMVYSNVENELINFECYVPELGQIFNLESNVNFVSDYFGGTPMLPLEWIIDAVAIQGAVADNNGAVIENALVKAITDNGIYSRATGDDGRFIFILPACSNIEVSIHQNIMPNEKSMRNNEQGNMRGNEENGVFIFEPNYYKLSDIDKDITGLNFVKLTTEEIIPKKFELHQNYPNPFNPETTIKYSLPVDCNVRIEITNILGQRVETLVDAFSKAGKYELKFDGSKYASGVYFYCLISGKYTDVKKMLILK